MDNVRLTFIVIVVIAVTACGGGGSGASVSPTPTATIAPTLTPTSPPTPTPTLSPTSRSFKMGFTPWVYEATLQAQNITYSRLSQHGDIIKHHLMSGIPWQAALDHTAYHANVEAEISGRLNQTPNGMTVLLAIDSLNTQRDGLPLLWQASANEPLPEPWAGYNWKSAQVIDAYLRFSLDMIERFEPEYFEYATEISELVLNDSSAFDDYLLFAEAIYDGVKAEYPHIKLVISIAAKQPGSAEATTIASNIGAILPYADVIGVSVYPYAFFSHADRGDPANLPTNWLSQMDVIAGDKPILISETGWIAENLEIPEYSLSVQSSASMQSLYTELLLGAAQSLSAEAVIWWAVTDYDELWQNTLNQDPLAKIWKDIGFYDENQQARPALDVWDSWLERDYQHNQ